MSINDDKKKKENLEISGEVSFVNEKNIDTGNIVSADYSAPSLKNTQISVQIPEVSTTPNPQEESLEDILENIGDVNCVIAKELTKIHEEFIRDKISILINEFKQKESIKGEYIILLDLNENVISARDEIKGKTIEEQYKFYASQGINKNEIIKKIAKVLEEKYFKKVTVQYM